ncbi:hypothetical protein [Spirosoma aerolatum]|uniref:hypothetical protein n=1 Tax=Spirosoma aerolatum TaxID=1211326 RepID=UPI0009AD9EFD|nr:hypothetical protein [Spirosoma aerolatum]
MPFLVNLYTQEQGERTFSFSGVSLGSGLDIINTLTHKGDQLRRVRYLDEYGVIDLPVCIFDGSPFSKSLGDLEQDWQQLLIQPNDWLQKPAQRDWLQRAQEIQQSRIAHLQECHDQMQRLIWTTQRQLKRGVRKDRLLRHYQQALHHFRTSLARTKDCQQVKL